MPSKTEFRGVSAVQESGRQEDWIHEEKFIIHIILMNYGRKRKSVDVAKNHYDKPALSTAWCSRGCSLPTTVKVAG